jgi:hypothetical protein
MCSGVCYGRGKGVLHVLAVHLCCSVPLPHQHFLGIHWVHSRTGLMNAQLGTNWPCIWIADDHKLQQHRSWTAQEGPH